jgi:hypothetical protein
MTTLHRLAQGRGRIASVTAVGVALAVWASFTHPFTVGADLVTAIPLGIGVVVLVRRLRTDRRPASVLRADGATARLAPLNRWALVWIGLLVTVVGWELYCYLSAPRAQHPTLSALIDMLDASPGGKFVAFLLWLALGWYLLVP